MTTERSLKRLREATAGLAQRADIEPRDLLAATWIALADKGILDEDDIACILDRAKGARTPGQPAHRPDHRTHHAHAGGHTLTDAGGPLDHHELIDEAAEESFPASDPPGYICQARAGAEPAAADARRRKPDPSTPPNQAYATGHSVTGEELSGMELVDEASEESFPASDPPSYMACAGRPGTPSRGGGA